MLYIDYYRASIGNFHIKFLSPGKNVRIRLTSEYNFWCTVFLILRVEIKSRPYFSLVRAQHNIVRVHGVQTVQNENTTEFIVDMCTEKPGVALTTNDIKACHHLRAPRRNGEGPPRPPPIIVMFNRRQKRDEVIKNRRELKGSRVVISEDLTSKLSTVYSCLNLPTPHGLTTDK